MQLPRLPRNLVSIARAAKIVRNVHRNLAQAFILPRNGQKTRQCDEKSKVRTIANVTLGFFFPLAGFIGIDLLLIRRKEKKKREAQAGGRDTGTI